MEDKRSFLLNLDLQTFAAEEGAQGDDQKNTEGDPADLDIPEPAEGKTPSDGSEDSDSKTFTQAQVDAIISERLARDRKKHEEAKAAAEAEAERKRLEEEQEYKSLADTYKTELDTLKQEAIESKKETELIKAGYTAEQATRYKRYIDGESDEEISTALETLMTDIPPKKDYIDPSPMTGGEGKPKPKDGEEVGKKMYERIKNKLF